MRRRLTILLALACLLASGLSCAGRQPAFTRDQAITRARAGAAQSAPELGILEARVERVSAEVITRAELARRVGCGVQATAAGEGPVWWVTVEGYFRYGSLPAPGASNPVYEANERYSAYDGRTGEELAGGVRGSHPAGADEEVLIYAAVVRHLVSQHLPPEGTWPAIYVNPRLTASVQPGEQVDGGPVPQELVAALQGLSPSVELAGLEHAVLPGPGVSNGGISITLGPVALAPDGTATLTATYYLGPLAAAGYEYHLKRQDGDWQFVEATVRVVS